MLRKQTNKHTHTHYIHFINHSDQTVSQFRQYLVLGAQTPNAGCQRNNEYLHLRFSGFGVLEVVCWPMVSGFAPSRSRRIFKAKKSSARLPSEGK